MSDNFAQKYLEIAPAYLKFLSRELEVLQKQIAQTGNETVEEEGEQAPRSGLLKRGSKQVEALFRPYLENQYSKAEAVTFGDKKRVVEGQITAVKNGQAPIQANPARTLKIGSDHPAVVSLREGRTIKLTDLPDETIGEDEGETTAQQTEQKKQQKRSLMMAGMVLMFFPIMGILWWMLRPAPAIEAQEPVAAATATAIITATVESPTVTPYPTYTLFPTLTPPPSATPLPTVTPPKPEATVQTVAYDERVRPVSLTLPNGQTERIFVAAQLDKWKPSHRVEWWPGTHIRRVFAMADEGRLLAELFQHIGDEIVVRLRSGHNVTYRMTDIQPATIYSTEQLYATDPSLALVIYPSDTETNTERWIVIAEAVQGNEQGGNSSPRAEDEIPGVVVRACEQNSARLTCTVQVSPEIDPNQLLITDASWLDALTIVPPTQIDAMSAVSDTAYLELQLTGTVRNSTAAPLLIYGEAAMQIAPSVIIKQSKNE